MLFDILFFGFSILIILLSYFFLFRKKPTSTHQQPLQNPVPIEIPQPNEEKPIEEDKEDADLQEKTRKTMLKEAKKQEKKEMKEARKHMVEQKEKKYEEKRKVYDEREKEREEREKKREEEEQKRLEEEKKKEEEEYNKWKVFTN